jgi:omega-6 fatty acid desaturase (delta-12 desaturase)
MEPVMDFTLMKQELKNWPRILHKYQQPSVKKAVVQILNSFLPFLGLWTLMYFSLRVSYLITLLLGLVNAFFLVRIFIIQHDCGHSSFLSSRKWMHNVGFFCSLVTTIPFRYWAKEHDFHHAHNGQLDQRDHGDIKTYTVQEFRSLSKFRKIKYMIFRSPVVLFIIGSFYYLVVHNRIHVISMKSFKRLELSRFVNNLILAGLYVGLMFLLGWKEFLLVQVSVLFPFAVISVWFFYVQHQHEHTYKNFRENWEYLLAAVRGSSYYKIPALFHWLTGNIGFHHIHHLNPRIPNYNLKKCFQENPVFTKYANSLNFIESLKTMQHKLWDEASQRMISFREFYRMEAALRTS